MAGDTFRFPTMLPSEEYGNTELKKFDISADMIKRKFNVDAFDIGAASMPSLGAGLVDPESIAGQLDIFDRTAASIPPVGFQIEDDDENDPVAKTVDFVRTAGRPAADRPQSGGNLAERSLGGLRALTGLANPIGSAIDMYNTATTPIKETRGREFLRSVGIEGDGVPARIGAKLVDNFLDVLDLSDIPNRIGFTAVHSALTGENLMENIQRYADDPNSAPKGDDILADLGVEDSPTRKFLGESMDAILDWRNMLFGAGGAAAGAGKGVKLLNVGRNFLAEPMGAVVGSRLAEGTVDKIGEAFGIDTSKAGKVAGILGQFAGAGFAGHGFQKAGENAVLGITPDARKVMNKTLSEASSNVVGDVARYNPLDDRSASLLDNSITLFNRKTAELLEQHPDDPVVAKRIQDEADNLRDILSNGKAKDFATSLDSFKNLGGVPPIKPPDSPRTTFAEPPAEGSPWYENVPTIRPPDTYAGRAAADGLPNRTRAQNTEAAANPGDTLNFDADGNLTSATSPGGESRNAGNLNDGSPMPAAATQITEGARDGSYEVTVDNGRGSTSRYRIRESGEPQYRYWRDLSPEARDAFRVGGGKLDYNMVDDLPDATRPIALQFIADNSDLFIALREESGVNLDELMVQVAKTEPTHAEIAGIMQKLTDPEGMLTTAETFRMWYAHQHFMDAYREAQKKLSGKMGGAKDALRQEGEEAKRFANLAMLGYQSGLTRAAQLMNVQSQRVRRLQATIDEASRELKTQQFGPAPARSAEAEENARMIAEILDALQGGKKLSDLHAQATGARAGGDGGTGGGAGRGTGAGRGGGAKKPRSVADESAEDLALKALVTSDNGPLQDALFQATKEAADHVDGLARGIPVEDMPTTNFANWVSETLRKWSATPAKERASLKDVFEPAYRKWREESNIPQSELPFTYQAGLRRVVGIIERLHQFATDGNIRTDTMARYETMLAKASEETVIMFETREYRERALDVLKQSGAISKSLSASVTGDMDHFARQMLKWAREDSKNMQKLFDLYDGLVGDYSNVLGLIGANKLSNWEGTGHSLVTLLADDLDGVVDQLANGQTKFGAAFGKIASIRKEVDNLVRRHMDHIAREESGDAQRWASLSEWVSNATKNSDGLYEFTIPGTQSVMRLNDQYYDMLLVAMGKREDALVSRALKEMSGWDDALGKAFSDLREIGTSTRSEEKIQAFVDFARAMGREVDPEALRVHIDVANSSIRSYANKMEERELRIKERTDRAAMEQSLKEAFIMGALDEKFGKGVVRQVLTGWIERARSLPGVNIPRELTAMSLDTRAGRIAVRRHIWPLLESGKLLGDYNELEKFMAGIEKNMKVSDPTSRDTAIQQILERVDGIKKVFGENVGFAGMDRAALEANFTGTFEKIRDEMARIGSIDRHMKSVWMEAEKVANRAENLFRSGRRLAELTDAGVTMRERLDDLTTMIDSWGPKMRERARQGLPVDRDLDESFEKWGAERRQLEQRYRQNEANRAREEELYGKIENPPVGRLDEWTQQVSDGLKAANATTRFLKEELAKAMTERNQEVGYKAIRDVYALMRKRGFAYAPPVRDNVVSPELGAAGAKGYKPIPADVQRSLDGAFDAISQGYPSSSFMPLLKDAKSRILGLDRNPWEHFLAFAQQSLYGSMLSSPTTSIVNVAGTGGTIVADTIGFQMYHRIRAALGDNDSALRATGHWMGLKYGMEHAVQDAMQTFRDGAPLDELDRYGIIDRVRIPLSHQYAAGSGANRLARFLEAPTSGLAAADAALWRIARSMHAGAEATEIALREFGGYKPGIDAQVHARIRSIIENPVEALGTYAGQKFLDRTFRYADDVTFKGDMGKMGKWIEEIQKFPGIGPLIIPFVRVIYHITARGMDMAPVLGGLSTGFDIMKGHYAPAGSRGPSSIADFLRRGLREDEVIQDVLSKGRQALGNPEDTRAFNRERDKILLTLDNRMRDLDNRVDANGQPIAVEVRDEARKRVRDEAYREIQALGVNRPRVSDAEIMKRYETETGVGAVNETPSHVPELAGRLRRNVFGGAGTIALSLWLMNSAENEMITGAGPTDPQQKAMLRAQGWQPYSIKVWLGGQASYVSYANLGPIAFPLSMAAGYVEGQRYGEIHDLDGKMAMRMIYATLGLLREQPYAQGIANIAKFMDPTEADEMKLDRFIASSVSSYVPYLGAMNYAGSLSDPQARHVNYQGNPFAMTGEIIQSKVPVWRESLPVAQDILGRSATNPRAIRGLGDAGKPFLPTRVTKGAPDDLLEELMALDLEVPRVARDIGGVPISDSESMEYRSIYSEEVDRLVRPIVNSPSYGSRNAEQKRKMLSTAMRNAGIAARKKFLRTLGGDARARKMEEADRVRENLEERYATLA